jgi:hypothetical protein
MDRLAKQIHVYREQREFLRLKLERKKRQFRRIRTFIRRNHQLKVNDSPLWWNLPRDKMKWNVVIIYVMQRPLEPFDEFQKRWVPAEVDINELKVHETANKRARFP